VACIRHETAEVMIAMVDVWRFQSEQFLAPGGCVARLPPGSNSGASAARLHDPPALRVGLCARELASRRPPWFGGCPARPR
jgi:hypothetical protein